MVSLIINLHITADGKKSYISIDNMKREDFTEKEIAILKILEATNIKLVEALPQITLTDTRLLHEKAYRDVKPEQESNHE